MNLDQIFNNSFDCYTQVQRGTDLAEEMAMSKGRFIEVVSRILMVKESVESMLQDNKDTNSNEKTELDQH